ncbi:MAG: SMP-30/gluconolactonase/LRE family protein [Thermoanaerobaculia bacterium]|nr:SMP-30/gluconolactonase/LRE family protein [Thermoanaerobaculia bacterium]
MPRPLAALAPLALAASLAAAQPFPAPPELFVDDPFDGCEGLSFNGEGRLFAACNRAVWEIGPDATVRRVTDVHSNLGLAPIGDRDLVMADFGPTNVFADGEEAPIDGVVWRIPPEGEKRRLAGEIRDPNAIVVRPDGALLVSDDGTDAIYRVTPDGGVSVFTRAVAYPNGLGLSRDGRTLYVAQIFRQMGPIMPDNRVWALPLDAAGEPAGEPRLLAELGEEGFNDGLALDSDGRVYVAENAGGRIWRIDPATGGKTLIAEGMPSVASLAFGHGDYGETTLYATATFRGGGKIWRVAVGARGAPLHR